MNWLANIGMDLYILYIPIISIIVSTYLSSKIKKGWMAPALTFLLGIALCTLVNFVFELSSHTPVRFNYIFTQMSLMIGVSSFFISSIITFALYIFKNRNN
ncbi:hypothetical protein [Bacillus massiliigorillae]|uniref:hypothetical protein n=1 Tax=Bacillus massiliigorillae TaxID=1243664 RepID=UPI0005AA242F|nr:hypothetical protein [Bacillus massiliigorillae]